MRDFSAALRGRHDPAARVRSPLAQPLAVRLRASGVYGHAPDAAGLALRAVLGQTIATLAADLTRLAGHSTRGEEDGPSRIGAT